MADQTASALQRCQKCEGWMVVDCAEDHRCEPGQVANVLTFSADTKPCGPFRMADAVDAALAHERQQHQQLVQALIDAATGTLDTSTEIADHPNVKRVQMERLKHQVTVKRLEADIAFKDDLIWTSRVSALYEATVAAEKDAKAARAELATFRAQQEQETPVIKVIAERAMLAVSDPHLSAEAYRDALRGVCTIAVAEIARLKGGE